jgi:hypothetical protein
MIGGLYAPSLFILWNSPLYPLNVRLGRSQSRPGSCGVEKISVPLLGIEPRFPGLTAYSLMCIYLLTELSRLSQAT